MASWKKIIVSGSDAELNALSLSGLSNQGSEATAVMINGSGVVGTRELGSNAFTTTTIGTTTNALTDGTGIADFTFNGSGAVSISTDDSAIVHDNLSGFVANEHIDHSSVSITAGNGLTGGGTIASTRTLAVGAGTGIDVAADAISVDVSDFMTNGSNNRIVTATGTDAMNAEANLTFDGTSLTLAGNITASGAISASGTLTVKDQTIITRQYFGGFGGSNIHLQAAGNNLALANGGFTTTGDITASGDISSSGTITANAFVGDGSGLTGLTSAANGTLTLATSGAINGSATFTANQSGDTTFTVSVDDATTSAKGVASFASADFGVSSGAVTIKSGGVSNTQLAGSIANSKLTNSTVSFGGIEVALGSEDATPAFDLQDAANYPTSALVGTITNAQLAGSIANGKLANDGITIAGVDTSLGGSITAATIVNAISGTVPSGSEGIAALLTAGEGIDIATNGTISGEDATTSNKGIASFASADFGVSSGAVTIKSGGVSNTQLAGSIANAKLSNSAITIAGTSTSLGGSISTADILNVDIGGDFTIGNQSSDTATFSGGVVVEGDLTVNGTLTTIATTNTIVKDQFTTFASGSTSATDGGFIVQGAANAGYALGYDTATTRWVFDNDLALDATGITADAYVGTIQVSTAAASGNPTYGGSSKGHGTIHVDTNTGDIFIYA